MFADRDAARRDEHVPVRLPQRAEERVAVVGDHVEEPRQRARSGETGDEERPVRLVELPRLELRAGRAKLRPGRENGDARPA